MESHSSLHVRLEKAKARMAAQEERRADLIKRKENVQRNIDLMPEVIDVLDRMYADCNGAAIKEYETILTNGVDEIIGDGTGVSLGLRAYMKSIALDIKSTKRGRIGDIMEGEGGGLTNVVCLGLRTISVARSRMRRFMLLDEPDCWLNNQRVNPFFGMVEEIAHQGFQIVTLTHHDISDINHSMNVIYVSSGGDNGSIVRNRDGIPDFPENMPGIRSIRLENFACYKDQTFYLSPGMNVIEGESNVGKSRLMRAMNCVVFGAGEESDIFFMDEDNRARWCRVTIEIENGRKIIWRRRIGTSTVDENINDMNSVEHWALVDKYGNTITLPDGTLCSDGKGEWVQRPEVMDIRSMISSEHVSPHLTQQKSPIYMLNLSPTMRASILSLSDESNKIQEMIKNTQKSRRDFDSEKKSIDKEISILSRELAVHHRFLPDLNSCVADIQEDYLHLERMSVFVVDGKKLYSEWILAKKKVNILKGIDETAQPTIPQLADVNAMVDIGMSYDMACDRMEICDEALREIKECEVSDFHNTDGMKGVYRTWSIANKRLDVLKNIPDLIVPPTLSDVDGMISVGMAHGTALDCYDIATEALRDIKIFEKPVFSSPIDMGAILAQYQDALKRLNEAEGNIGELDQEYETLKNHIADLEQQLGVCPMCGGEFQHKEHSHA